MEGVTKRGKLLKRAKWERLRVVMNKYSWLCHLALTTRPVAYRDDTQRQPKQRTSDIGVQDDRMAPLAG